MVKYDCVNIIKAMSNFFSDASDRGFALMEFLVVIGLAAALAVAVVFVLSPAKLLKRGRASTHLSDLASLDNVLAPYVFPNNSSGSVVWDFTGNVWQRVQRSAMNPGGNTNTISLLARSDGAVHWNWGQYWNSTIPYIFLWSSDIAQANISSSSTSRNSTSTGANGGITVSLPGGYWDDGLNVAAFALQLGWGIRYGHQCGGGCAR